MHTVRALSWISSSVILLGTALAQIQITPLFELEGETSKPSLSPDGKTLAFDWCKPDYSCGIYTRPLAGSDVRFLTGRDSREGMPTSPRWSPDGKKIAFSRFYSHFDNHLIVLDLASRIERDLGLVCDSSPEGTWSPDSRFIATSVYREDPSRSLECRPALFSAEKGTRSRSLATLGSAPALSPDGRMLAYANEGALMLLRLDSDYRPAAPASVLAREQREIAEVNWTPDGKQILYLVWRDSPHLRRIALTPGSRPQAIPGLDSQLQLTQLTSGGRAFATETTQVSALWRADLGVTPPRLETIPDQSFGSGIPGCSPDGRSRAFFNAPTGVTGLWLSDANGNNERPLVKTFPSFVDPADDASPSLAGWSPDSKWIAFTTFPSHGNADGRSYLFVVPAAGGLLRRLGSTAYSIFAPVWSVDSRSIYATQDFPYDDSTQRERSPLVRVDVANGQITPLGAHGLWPRLSPDGKMLYFVTNRREGLARIPTAGGMEESLLQRVRSLYAYAVGSRSVYLFRDPPGDHSGLATQFVRFDLESREVTILGEIPFRPRFAALSKDERFLYFDQQDDPKRRAVMVRGLF